MVRAFTQSTRLPKRRIDPLIRLWALRMLVPLGGHTQLIRALDDNPLVRALGLDHWADGGGDSLPPKAARAELARLHREAERKRDDMRVPHQLRRNVAHLATAVGLNDSEQRILEFTVLIHKDRDLERAADLVGELSSAEVSRALAVVLGLPEGDVRSALTSSGKLARSGLVAVAASERFTDNGLKDKLELLSKSFSEQMLCEAADIASLLRGTISITSPAQLSLADFPHIGDSLRILMPYLRQALESRSAGVNFFVHGAPGTGKSQLARALAAALACDLFEVACEDEEEEPISGPGRLRAFNAAQIFFDRQRSLIVFDEAEDVFNDGGAEFFSPQKSTALKRKAWINRMLEENPVPTVWLSNSNQLDPAFLRRFDMVFELPVPPLAQRRRVVEALCQDLTDALGVERIAASEHLAPAIVARAAQVVRCIGDPLDLPTRGHALEQLINNTLKAQGQDVLKAKGGDASLMVTVYEPALLNADADMAQVAAGLRAMPSGRLCLYGPPGTGKSAYGRWLAAQLDKPLLLKRGSDLLSEWVGGTEKNICSAFNEASDTGAVLLIDEIDSFLQNRLGAQRHWEASQVNEMLTQMEVFKGILVASTNLMDGLDPAALRRFDLKVKFDFLRPEQAVALLHQCCARIGLSAPGERDEAMLRGASCITPGDFAAAARRHRFLGFQQPGQFVAALLADLAVKTGGKAAIGFI